MTLAGPDQGAYDEDEAGSGDDLPEPDRPSGEHVGRHLVERLLDPQTGSFQYINAGHNPPVLIRPGGELELLAPSGPAVGIIPKAGFDIREGHLDPGDALFCYTDGVPEAKDPDGRFLTDAGMLDVLRTSEDSAQEILDRMTAALAAHVREADQYDDITMLVLHRHR